MHGGRLPTAPKEGPSSGVLDLVETAGNRDGLEDGWTEVGLEGECGEIENNGSRERCIS